MTHPVFLPRKNPRGFGDVRIADLIHTAHYRRAAEGLLPTELDVGEKTERGLHYFVFAREWALKGSYVRHERVPLTRDRLYQAVVEQAVRRDVDLALRNRSDELEFLKTRVREQEQIILSVLSFLRETAAEAIQPRWPFLNWQASVEEVQSPDEFVVQNGLEDTLATVKRLAKECYGNQSGLELKLRRDRESDSQELLVEIHFDPSETPKLAQRQFLSRYSDSIPPEDQKKIAILRLPK